VSALIQVASVVVLGRVHVTLVSPALLWEENVPALIREPRKLGKCRIAQKTQDGRGKIAHFQTPKGGA
jgi:hypothetical protein